ncbi:MAG: hypothetical protein AB7P76_00345 [Candidatus Melainabacteria bacterium]
MHPVPPVHPDPRQPAFGGRPQGPAILDANEKPIRFHRLTPEEQQLALTYAEAAGDGVIMSLVRQMKPPEKVAYLHTKPWQEHSRTVLDAILPLMTPRQRDEYLHGKRLQDAFARFTGPMVRLADMLDTRVWRARLRHHVALKSQEKNILPYQQVEELADGIRQASDAWFMLKSS